MQEFILNKIKMLPPLNESTIQIQQICNSADASIDDLSKVVEKDPMLTANILKSANSPLYGFSREINNVKYAVNLFGMTTIKGFALNAAVKNSFKIDLSAYKLNEAKFLELSTMQNSLAINWLAKAGESIKNTIIPASFMLEIGKIIISSELVERNMVAEFLSGLENIQNPSQLQEYERQIIGLSSLEVAALVFDKWNLEIDMIDSIKYALDLDNAPNDIKQKASALNIVLNLVNIFKAFDEEEVNACIKLANDENLFSEELNKAISILNQNA
ncbi:HDOD domain-containing protein [Campylobacter canadensis]|uniref:HDOD domain-containing protein n=1 Tax=Campylobacter canadensis TaxID=449520 RepID=UPI001CC9375A|nr:HDOD domain-containing protein [Campylobacter canadensis]MBZ8004500.1 HDOD domain-containing protein [Campylobacter canadensis]